MVYFTSIARVLKEKGYDISFKGVNTLMTQLLTTNNIQSRLTNREILAYFMNDLLFEELIRLKRLSAACKTPRWTLRKQT